LWPRACAAFILCFIALKAPLFASSLGQKAALYF